jgi:hypothetical protein
MFVISLPAFIKKDVSNLHVIEQFKSVCCIINEEVIVLIFLNNM